MAYSKNRRLAEIVSDTSGNLSVEGLIVPTQSSSDNDTSAASTAFVHTHIDAVLDSAPGTLNTLNEIAAALNDDANFNTTVTNAIAAKLPLAGGTLSGNLGIGASPGAPLHITHGTPSIKFTDSSSSANYSMTLDGVTVNNTNAGTNGSIAFHTHNGEKLRLGATNSYFSNTNVGIGTSSPDTNLEVESNAGASTIIRVKGTASDGYRHGFEASNTHTGGSVWSMFSTNNSDGYFGGGKFGIANETMGNVDANTAAVFVIDGTGKVGIGTKAPATDLQIGDYTDNAETLTFATASDQTGRINFYNANNTEGASLRVTGGGAGAKMYFANRYDSDADKVTFDLVNGRVGIGTTSPAQPLTIKSNGAVSYNGATDLDGESFLTLEGTSADGEAAMIRWANHGGMNNYFGVVQVGSSGQGDFVWTSYNGSAYAERMRLNKNGNVGIGAASNTARLRVEQSVNSEWAAIIKHAGTSVNYGLSIDTSAGSSNAVGALQVYTPAGGGLILTNAGRLGVGNNNPNKPLTVTSDGGANGIAIRARSADDYGFFQFFNNAGTALRGQIYSHSNSIGFTTGTDSSAGNDLYIKDGVGVGIGTTAPYSKLNVQGTSASTYTGAGPGATIRASQSTDGNWIASDVDGKFAYFGIDGNDAKFAAYNYASSAEMGMVLGQNRMYIKSNGNVGIGTTAPDDKLDIMGGGYDQIRIGSNKTDNTNKLAGIVSTTYTNESVSFLQGYFQNGTNSVYYGSADASHRGIQNHYFYVNTNYNSTSNHKLAYKIKASGGGGHEWHTQSNSNSKKLALHNGEGLWLYNNGGGSYSSYGTGAALRVTELSYNQSAQHYIEIGGNLPGYTAGAYNCLKTDMGDLHFAAGGTYTGYISSGGTFTDISDVREKENIVTITNATTKLKQLRGVYHTWKDTENRGTGTTIGLIAQEVEAVVPEVVTTSNPTSLNTPASDTAGLKGVAYAKLVPLLIETIKELEARITTLEG